MKYKYMSKSFLVKDIIELPDDSIIIKSTYDWACNHHPYEYTKGDMIYIQWLELMKEELL